MNKSKFNIILLLIFLLIVSSTIYLIANKTNPLVKELNGKCLNIYCTPFIDMCDQWKATAYDHDWRSCKPIIEAVLSLNDLSVCKQIDRKELATYCISLTTRKDNTRNKCLEYAGNNRTLQAICHITKSKQYLFQNITSGEYYILDSSNSPSILIWQENENNSI